MAPIILPRISDQKPLVSVVSITYNHEPYIRDCLEGFLMQKTDFPVEIIIHDDASTDHTADIIREYYEKRPDLFHVIIERVNQYSQHKQILIPLYKQAKGKYIALCEGDDYWTDPLKLQKQFDFLEKNKDFIAVTHRFNVINKTGAFLEKETSFFCYREEESGVFTIKDWESPKNHIIPSHIASLMFRNFYIDKVFSYPKELSKINVAGDQKLYLLLLLHGNIYRQKEVMSIYRYVREEGGNSYSSRQINEFDPLKAWKNYSDFERYAQKRGASVVSKAKFLLLERVFFKRAVKEKSLSYWIGFFHYLIVQDGAITNLFSMAFHKILKKTHIEKESTPEK